MDVLVFHLNAQRYGLPVADVQEVVRAVAVAPLPKAPRIVEGVIDVRGRLVPPHPAGVPAPRQVRGRGGASCIVLAEHPAAAGPGPIGSHGSLS